MLTWDVKNGEAWGASLMQALIYGSPWEWSATEFELKAFGGHKIVLEGSFTPNGAYPPIDGTISGFRVYAGDELVLDAEGYSISLLHWNLMLLNLKAAEDFSALVSVLFNDEIVINGSSGSDYLYGGLVKATILAEGGKDDITGSFGDDTILCGTGNDTAYGGPGDDTIKGGGGKDAIIGAEGKDVLTGGAGKDAFVFVTAPGKADADVITDFKPGTDTIHLDNFVFKGIGPDGGLKAKYFHLGKKAEDGNDRVIYDAKTGALFYDRDGSGDTYAKLKVASLDGTPKLTHDDFLVI